jgi:hypothetical protein
VLRVTQSHDAIGATFVIGLGIVVRLAHLLAARDPDGNAITRLMRDYYEHTGAAARKLAEPPSNAAGWRRRVPWRFSGIGGPDLRADSLRLDVPAATVNSAGVPLAG